MALLTDLAATPPRPPAAGIVHLGLGNFHRAHQAVYTAAALGAETGDWGILGVASRSRRVVEPMRRQEGRYSVLTLAPEGARAEVLAVHSDTYVAAEETARLVEDIAASRTRVLTLTVTEHGYGYSHRRGGLDLDAAGVRHDLTAAQPVTAVGQVAMGLLARYRGEGAPLAVVSCDNVSDNGAVLRRLVTDLLAERPEPDAVAAAEWVSAQVGFPSTMVDRIVPATLPEHEELAGRLLGASDAVPVPAEPFSMWVLEDDFPAGRPRWEAGGALVTAEVAAYEQVKLRILNASNSLLAYLGLLLGERLIADTVVRPGVREVVEHMMRTEMLPTIDVPAALDVDDYVHQLFGRFANRAVGHRSAQVGTDGSTKLPVRLTEPVLHHHGRGQVPGVLALLAATYLRTFADVSSIPGAAERPADPYADRLAGLGQRHPHGRGLARAVLADSGIFPPALGDAAPWLDRVGDLLEVLRRAGVDAAMAEALP